ncbi:MAG: YraN family protein [Gammaproteobacteria bacterium]
MSRRQDAGSDRGQQAEDLACRYLQAQGWQLLERNYRCKRGELDLIMRHKDSIVFVEVRYRNTLRFGGGVESVDRHKQSKLIACAQHYLQHHKLGASPCRFDVVALLACEGQDKVEWIKDAFQA